MAIDEASDGSLWAVGFSGSYLTGVGSTIVERYCPA
jgi:hypothetical protein